MAKKVHLEFSAGAAGLPEQYQGFAELMCADETVGGFYIPSGKVSLDQIIGLAKADVPVGYELDETHATHVIEEWLKQ